MLRPRVDSDTRICKPSSICPFENTNRRNRPKPEEISILFSNPIRRHAQLPKHRHPSLRKPPKVNLCWKYVAPEMRSLPARKKIIIFHSDKEISIQKLKIFVDLKFLKTEILLTIVTIVIVEQFSIR